MGIFEILWIGWFIAFAIVEVVALRRDKIEQLTDKNKNGVKDDGFSLSAHIRKWFRINTALGRTIFLVVFMIFVGWFLIHIISGTM